MLSLCQKEFGECPADSFWRTGLTQKLSFFKKNWLLLRAMLKRIRLIIIILQLILQIVFTVEADEDPGSAYYDLGIFAYEEGDYKDAEANFRKAIQLNPNHPIYNHYMGKTCMETERYQDAEKYFVKAWDINPDLSGLKYDMAILNYKMEDYSKAADLFIEIAEQNPSDAVSYYYAGISLFKQERYKDAVNYFIAASEKHPSLKTNAYYYAGICYLKTGENETAAEKFTYLKEHADSELLRKHASDWLQAMEQQKKPLKPYQVYLKLSYQYDNNVKLEQRNQQNIEYDDYEDKGDYVTKAYLSCLYNFIRQKNYQLGAGYSHYQTWYNHLTEYNLTGSIFNFYANYRSDPVTLGVSYIPSYYWLDSDSFLMRHQMRTDIRWNINRNFMSRLSYTYSKDNYFEDNDSDGHSHEVISDIYYRIGSKGYFLWEPGYEKNSASGDDKDYSLINTKLGVIINLFRDMNLAVTGEYTHKRYENPEADTDIKRRDIKYNGNILLSRKLFYEWLEISAEFDYTKNDSNMDEYEYERKTTALSVNVIF